MEPFAMFIGDGSHFFYFTSGLLHTYVSRKKSKWKCRKWSFKD